MKQVILIMKTCPFNTHSFYQLIKNEKFDLFNIFAQNIDCGVPEAVLTSSHYPCFGSKIRKIGIPLSKWGYEGKYISWTCFPDVKLVY